VTFERDREAELGNAPRHLEVLRNLCDLYESRGLLDAEGRDRPLYEICPNCAGCWADRSEGELPRQRARAGIAVPWIGEHYFAHRIALLGINFNDWGGLHAHWQICRSHRAEQEAGHPGHNGREFGFGAAAYVKAVEAAIEGSLNAGDTPPASPTDVSDAWALCAFWEAVKCAPNRPRGEPYAPMWGNCIDLLLLEEMERLRPRVVLALGRTRLRDSVRPHLRERRRLSWGSHNGLERDTFHLEDGSPVELFSLNHPGRRPHWHHSFQALNHSLTAQPLGSN
jgi:hypothetical protein